MTARSKASSPSTAMGRGELAGVALDVLVPVLVYYVLRSVGLSEWLALLAGAAAPAVRAGWALIRHRTLNWFPTAALVVLAVSTTMSFIADSPRFLLAKDGIIKAAIGAVVLGTLAADRPIMYTVSRAFVGMAGHSPNGWDRQWDSSARFRRIWRVVTVIWGASALASAAAKVLFACTLPIDVVPAISIVQWAAVLVGLNAVTQLYLRRPANKPLVFD
ncbi:VC0807 family protein [Bounagaea algeriensis]